MRRAGDVFANQFAGHQLGFAIFGVTKTEHHHPDDVGEVVFVDEQFDGTAQVDVVHDGRHCDGKVSVAFINYGIFPQKNIMTFDMFLAVEFILGKYYIYVICYK